MTGPRIPAALVAAFLLSIFVAGCADAGGEAAPNENPRAAMMTTPALPLAPGEAGSFSVADADAVLWRMGDETILPGQNVTHAFAEPGLYVVDVETLREGVRSAAATIVAVASDEGPALTISTQETPVGLRFSMDSDAQMVAWDFGDGTVASQSSVVHAHAEPGPFEVRAYAIMGDQLRMGSVVVEPAILSATFLVSSTGQAGPEPTMGTTRDDCVFFAANTKMMRTCDAGATWHDTTGPLTSPPEGFGPDPLAWVDPVTDRIFSVHLLEMGLCIWVGWSDDGGNSWLGNPLDCGLPLPDHQKLTTGAWTQAGLALNPVYPQAVYLCMNRIAGAWCNVSLDGGATFPIGRYVAMADNVDRAFGTGVEIGGLHGPVVAGPDGSVYLPLQSPRPVLEISRDNGLTWTEKRFGLDAVAPIEYVDPEVAVDAGNNVYFLQRGADEGLHLYRSFDRGESWSDDALRVTAGVGSASHPTIVAGDEGHVAIAYYGSPDANLSGSYAPDDARWFLYVSYTRNGLDDAPDFHTVRVSDDPIQRGPLCVSICFGDDNYNLNDPLVPASNNNNLLEFMDIHMDRHGRIHVAFTDGCTNACASDLEAPAISSRSQEGKLAVLQSGPSLLGGALAAP